MALKAAFWSLYIEEGFLYFHFRGVFGGLVFCGCGVQQSYEDELFSPHLCSK